MERLINIIKRNLLSTGIDVTFNEKYQELTVTMDDGNKYIVKISKQLTKKDIELQQQIEDCYKDLRVE